MQLPIHKNITMLCFFGYILFRILILFLRRLILKDCKPVFSGKIQKKIKKNPSGPIFSFKQQSNRHSHVFQFT